MLAHFDSRFVLRSLLSTSLTIALFACSSGPSSDEPTGGRSSAEVGKRDPDAGDDASRSTDGDAGAPPTILVAEFDRSRAADIDCEVAYEGDVCEACPCPNAAIATSDVVTHSSVFAARKASCPPSNDECVGLCNVPRAECKAGTCAIVQ